MLFLNSTSRIRASTSADVLTLTTKHCLQLPSQAGPECSVKNTRFFDVIHALSASSIIFTLSGALDRAPVTQDEMLKSELSRHFLDYLRRNACQLGLSNVSDLYVDDEDGQLKIAITPESCRQPFHEQIPLRVFLREIHIQYSWQISKSHEGSSRLASPFSSHLSLPFRGLVDNVVSRFATWHLVRRYPLIFGSWCKQLDTEASFFPVIFRSILEMVKRSSDSSFRTRVKELLKIMKRQHLQLFKDSYSSLSEYLDLDPNFADRQEIKINQETAFYLSMELLYRNGSKRPILKCSGSNMINRSDILDDDELSHDQSIPTSRNAPSNGNDDSPWLVPSPNLPCPDRLGYFDSDVFDVPGVSIDSLLGGYQSDEELGINLLSDELTAQESRYRSTSPCFLGSQGATAYNGLDEIPVHHTPQVTRSNSEDVLMHPDHDSTLASQPSQYAPDLPSCSQFLRPDEEDLDLNMNSDLECLGSPRAASFPSPQTSQNTLPPLTHLQSDEEDLNIYSDPLEAEDVLDYVEPVDSLDNQDYGTCTDSELETLSRQPVTSQPVTSQADFEALRHPLLAPASNLEDFLFLEPYFPVGRVHPSSVSLDELANRTEPAILAFLPSNISQEITSDFSVTESNSGLHPGAAADIDTDIEIAEFDEGWSNWVTRDGESREEDLVQGILDLDQDYTDILDGQLLEHETAGVGGRVKYPLSLDHGTLEWELDGDDLCIEL
ncbi:hypothetical protein K435DRAFT_962184 [Dendrothele bispora CBS 962.96]|uniref:Uncharacterized protein n=1 Tax=Dendrothele bispora (strain CBS 962.96) TaxID=1314807 RepID=A0A4S8MLV2_DENBC|nr:hypothetical protein K435DRAFT_962184 [Dendrothele bispora CBS 962.96]